MGVHKKERERSEVEEYYIKKTSCIMLVLMALLMGTFVGNTVTMLYIGDQGTNSASNSNPPQSPPSTADAATLSGLEGAAAADPTSAAKWVSLGNYCFDNDLPQKAASAYERALELSPMQVGVWSDLGVMYRRTQQFDKAIEAFGHAASLDPKHKTSRFNMGIVYLYDLEDKVGAIKAWKDVLAIDPNAVSPNGKKVSELIAELGG